MQIFLSLLLTFALPITGALQGGNAADVGVQVNPVHGSSEGSGDTTQVIRREPFPDPSIIERIQDAHLLLALRAMDASGDSDASSIDFWELAKEAGKSLQDFGHRLLEGAAACFQSTAFTDIASAMNHTISATTTFRDHIHVALNAHNITFDVFVQELDGVFTGILMDLENIPPSDSVPGHAERVEIVDSILNATSQGLLQLTTRYGIEEEAVTTYIFALKPQVRQVTVAVGDIIEQHPQLFHALVFCVVALLTEESWILKPLLNLLGFGSAGPVKGSVAALWQSRLWGPAVDPGSWFAMLQAAGMGVLPKWAGLVTKVPLLFGGLMAVLLPCFNQG